jgi:hypothetical protein
MSMRVYPVTFRYPGSALGLISIVGSFNHWTFGMSACALYACVTICLHRCHGVRSVSQLFTLNWSAARGDDGIASADAHFKRLQLI